MAHGEGTLRALLRAVAADHGYYDNIDVKAITSDGANYTSVLYLATIASPPKPDLKLFAKVGCFSEKIRATVNADRLYKTEDIIYNRLVSLWENLQEKYQVPEDRRFVFPKYYAGSLKAGSETVVLEDLVAAGYRSFNRFKSMDWEHAASAVTELAKYHALSFILEKEDPVVYGEVAKELAFQPMTENEGSKAIWEKMIGAAAQVIEEQHRGKMLNFFANAKGNVYTEFRTPRGRPILVHGDYRLSNLLFRKKNDKLESIVLDYQTVHTGCPVTDLIYLVCMGSDAAFRRAHYRPLVDLYHQQLGDQLRLYQMSIDDVYPRQEFDDDMKMLLPYAVLLGVIILPVVTVEAERAPCMNDDGAQLEDFIVKPNDLYAERFSGLIADLVNWGAI